MAHKQRPQRYCIAPLRRSDELHDGGMPPFAGDAIMQGSPGASLLLAEHLGKAELLLKQPAWFNRALHWSGLGLFKACSCL